MAMHRDRGTPICYYENVNLKKSSNYQELTAIKDLIDCSYFSFMSGCFAKSTRTLSVNSNTDSCLKI